MYVCIDIKSLPHIAWRLQLFLFFVMIVLYALKILLIVVYLTRALLGLWIFHRLLGGGGV